MGADFILATSKFPIKISSSLTFQLNFLNWSKTGKMNPFLFLPNTNL